MKGAELVCVPTHGSHIERAITRARENGVWLADGKRRPLERPKQKNPRHLRPLDIELGREAMTTNRALRRALRAVTERDAQATAGR